MCSYMRMFTVSHILIAWRMLRKGCYGNSNVLAFSIVGQTKTIQWFQCHAWMRFVLFLKMEEKKSPFSKISGYLCTCGQLRYCSRKGYIATTGTRFTWKKIIQSQRFLKTTDSPAFFANAPITFEKMRAVSWEVRYAWLNLEFYCSVCKKTLRIYDFQKTLWLDNLLASAQFEWSPCKTAISVQF